MGFSPSAVVSLTIVPTTLFLVARFISQSYESITFSVAIIAISSLSLFSYITWVFVLVPHYFSPLLVFPSPPGGNYFTGFTGRLLAEAPGTALEEWVNTVPNDGLIQFRGLFNINRLTATNPKALHEILSQKNYDFIKPPDFITSLGRILGQGLLLVEGDVHKAQRKNLNPAFAFRHVKNLYSVFWDKGYQMVAGVTSEIEKGLASEASKAAKEGDNTDDSSYEIEFSGWSTRAALDIIGIAGMGIQFNSIQDPDSELVTVYRQLFSPSAQAVLLTIAAIFLPGIIIRNLPIQRNSEILNAVKLIRATCLDAIQRKRSVQEKTGKYPGNDILSVAMESGGFSDENLVDQMMTFLAAGHETTASSMVWTLYYLSKHPDVQTRLREEIRANLPSPTADGEMDDKLIDSLPYLQAVTQEVLRVMPPVPLTARAARVDTTLLGQFIPKGTRILLSPRAVNRSKALWGDDAAEFKPERWLKGTRAASGGAESSYANMTFLQGTRVCIGRSFAQAEFKCLLAPLIGRIEFSLRDPNWVPVVKGVATARPQGGLKVLVKKLEGW